MTTWTWAACKAYLLSQAYQLWAIIVTVVGIGYSLGPSKGGFNDFPTFKVYLGVVWFPSLLAMIFGIGPYARAKQGGDTATTVVKSATATSIPNSLVNEQLIPAVGTTVPKGP